MPNSLADAARRVPVPSWRQRNAMERAGVAPEDVERVVQDGQMRPAIKVGIRNARQERLNYRLRLCQEKGLAPGKLALAYGEPTVYPIASITRVGEIVLVGKPGAFNPRNISLAPEQ